MITLPRRAILDSVRPHLEAKLEEEYEGHTQVLAGLMERRARRAAVSAHAEAAVADARRAIADVASALRRMAEGSYGSCEICSGEIEVEYLEARPTARCCTSCAAWSMA